MQYKRYFFQYAQPGAYDRLGPARPCRCGVTASDSLVPGLIADMKQGASWDTIRSSSRLIGWVTWSRAHKSSVGAARKVSPNWSQETMTCHSSNCFSIVRGQGRTIGVTPLGSFIRREGRGLMSEQRITIAPKRSSYLLISPLPLTIKMAARIHQ